MDTRNIEHEINTLLEEFSRQTFENPSKMEKCRVKLVEMIGGLNTYLSDTRNHLIAEKERLRLEMCTKEELEGEVVNILFACQQKIEYIRRVEQSVNGEQKLMNQLERTLEKDVHFYNKIIHQINNVSHKFQFYDNLTEFNKISETQKSKDALMLERDTLILLKESFKK
jgi:hypothetical protein